MYLTLWDIAEFVSLEFNLIDFYMCFLLVSDKAIGEVFKACEETGYVLMITADHGNAEQMFSEQGGPHTAHTTNRGN